MTPEASLSLTTLLGLPLHLDGAHVGRPHRGQAEEAPPPLTLEDNSGVELEQPLDVSQDRRRHAQQLAPHTCPRVHVPRDRGVETVIVTRMEIYHDLIQSSVFILK